MADYAATCLAATGIPIPDQFDCNNGTLVPTEDETAPPYPNSDCDRPNVLNSECDRTSKFHVLAKTSTAFVVAHCRKKGLGIDKYGDIAIIQHNQVNGATCFYQAYPNMGGAGTELDHTVYSPANNPPAQTYTWMTQTEINSNPTFRCINCHDTGPLIRSPYLAQLADQPGANSMNRLPGTSDLDADWPKTGFNMAGKPYSFPGNQFQSWKAASLTISNTGCTSCHRMGSGSVGGEVSANVGTSRLYGVVATDDKQMHKNAYDPANPLKAPSWYHYMNGSNGPVVAAQNDAALYQRCAISRANGDNPLVPDGCTQAPFAAGYNCGSP